MIFAKNLWLPFLRQNIMTKARDLWNLLICDKIAKILSNGIKPIRCTCFCTFAVEVNLTGFFLLFGLCLLAFPMLTSDPLTLSMGKIKLIKIWFLILKMQVDNTWSAPQPWVWQVATQSGALKLLKGSASSQTSNRLMFLPSSTPSTHTPPASLSAPSPWLLTWKAASPGTSQGWMPRLPSRN